MNVGGVKIGSTHLSEIYSLSRFKFLGRLLLPFYRSRHYNTPPSQSKLHRRRQTAAAKAYAENHSNKDRLSRAKIASKALTDNNFYEHGKEEGAEASDLSERTLEKLLLASPFKPYISWPPPWWTPIATESMQLNFPLYDRASESEVMSAHDAYVQGI